MKNLTLPEEVVSILGAGARQTPKSNQIPWLSQIFINFCREDLLVNIFKFTEGIFYIYCQSKDMEDFLNLLDKFEPPNLKSFLMI